MKKRMSKLLMLFFLLSAGLVSAQERVVSGSVTDQEGFSAVAATVVVTGTNIGTVTDTDGNFILEIPEGAETLTISYVGMEPKVVPIADVMNVSLAAGENVLDNVVVTAFGIEREEKTLGYAVTELDQETFEMQAESDVSRIISGKVPGVNINPGGGFLGSGTSIIVRSKGSITGSNQPLYVVDGSPFSGNIQDIDPNSIVSTSVLKGLAASVLYGQKGRNGVILIETKNAARLSDESKIDVSLTQTFVANEIANLPDFQNSYGNGGDNTTVIGYIGSWGAKFNPEVLVPHPYSTGRDPRFETAFPEFQGLMVPYVAAENNVKDFFSTGNGSTTSLNLNSSKKDMNVSFNLGYDDQIGYVSENTYKKINIGTGINTDLSDRFNLSSSLRYTNVDMVTPTDGIFDRLMYLPRSLDLMNLPFENPADNSSIFYRTDLENPRWQLKNQAYNQERNRLYLTTRASFDITEDFGLHYQIGYDNYDRDFNSYSNKGGVYGDNAIGWVSSSTTLDQNLDQNLQLVMSEKQLNEKFAVTGLLGTNYNSDSYESKGIYSTEQLVYGVLDHDNFVNHDNGGDYESKVNLLGVYGQADFSMDDWMFVTLSARNDWGSTVEEENRSTFYPSISSSFVISDLTDLGNDVDFLKIRAGYATSAGYPSPYYTRPTLGSDASVFVTPDGETITTNSISSFQPNPNLKPELAKEYEFGVDAWFFKKRINLDATYFFRINEEQILGVSRPGSTGFTNTVINAGRIDTKGVEIGLGLTPVVNDDFNWSSNFVFTAFENEVKDLPENNLNVYGGINYAIEGEPLGVFRGSYALRDDQGRLIINKDNGKVISSEAIGAEDKILGDPNEDWRGTWINELTYKNFILSGQLEYTHGGDIVSYTAESLLRRGVTTDTEDRGGTYVMPGVLGDPNTGEVILDDNGNPIENTIQISPNDVYFLNTQDPRDAKVYDATTFRIRSLSLGYRLPENLFNTKFFKGGVVNISANNLHTYTPNMPQGFNLDPEVLGGGLKSGAQGIDFNNDPAYRKISASVKFNF